MQGLDHRRTAEGIVFKIHVQPRSSKNMIAGLHGDALKLKITSPPVDNAANRMCIKFLAELLDVSPARLHIVSGHTARIKQVLLKSESGQPSEKQADRLARQIQTLIKPTE